MFEVTARLQVRPGESGATRVVMAEEMERLRVELSRAFQTNIPVAAQQRPGQPRIRDTVRSEPLDQMAGFWRLKFYANWRIRFLIKGARPHEIRPSHAGGAAPELRFAEGGSFVFAGDVHHPGMHKNPFIARTLEQTLPGAVVRLRSRMGQAIVSDLRSAV